jgi:hypothetical protein
MNGIEWSRIGYLLLGGAIGVILVVPIVIMLNELGYWIQCKRNGWTHEWLVLDDILGWIRK